MEPRRALWVCAAVAALLLSAAAASTLYERTRPGAAPPAALAFARGADLANADEEGYLVAASFAPDRRQVDVSLRAFPGDVVEFDELLSLPDPDASERAVTVGVTLASSAGGGLYDVSFRDASGALITHVAPIPGGAEATRVVPVPAQSAVSIGFTYRGLDAVPGSGAVLHAQLRLA